MPTKNIFHLAAQFALLATVTLTCTRYEYNNPLDPSYTGGNYSFAVDTTALKGTLEIFRTYKVPIERSSDTFVAYGVDESLLGFIDTLLIKRKSNRDTLCLFFTKPYVGAIPIRAIRPNEREMFDTVTVNLHSAYYQNWPFVQMNKYLGWRTQPQLPRTLNLDLLAWRQKLFHLHL